MIISTRLVWLSQSCLGSKSNPSVPPPLLTSIVLQCFQAVSRPRLSYTPPSASTICLRKSGSLTPGAAAIAGSKLFGSRFSTQGDSSGGTAEDAPTALASSTSGFLTRPTFQSPMYALVKRHNTPVCRLVALKTNRGAYCSAD